jgi:hypothetical protein
LGWLATAALVPMMAIAMTPKNYAVVSVEYLGIWHWSIKYEAYLGELHDF